MENIIVLNHRGDSIQRIHADTVWTIKVFPRSARFEVTVDAVDVVKNELTISTKTNRFVLGWTLWLSMSPQFVSQVKEI